MMTGEVVVQHRHVKRVGKACGLSSHTQRQLEGVLPEQALARDKSNVEGRDDFADVVMVMNRSGEWVTQRHFGCFEDRELFALREKVGNRFVDGGHRGCCVVDA